MQKLAIHCCVAVSSQAVEIEVKHSPSLEVFKTRQNKIQIKVSRSCFGSLASNCQNYFGTKDFVP